jgi:hypothetical protein
MSETRIMILHPATDSLVVVAVYRHQVLPFYNTLRNTIRLPNFQLRPVVIKLSPTFAIIVNFKLNNI